MENIEEAYEYLSRYALSFVENRCWDEIYCKFQIYSTMVTAEQYYIFNLEKNNKGGFSIVIIKTLIFPLLSLLYK